MYIHNHILVGTNVDFNWSKKNNEPLRKLDTIVIHYTASSSALTSVDYLVQDNIPVSAHLLIARDGNIYQMVDFKTQAWHAGNSIFKGRDNINEFSIGIELENAGALYEDDDSYFLWCGRKIPDSQVVQFIKEQNDVETNWHNYTHKQLCALEEVCKLLIMHYNIRYIVGHNEISLTGKIDPGPAFPMREFKKLLKTTKRL